MSRNVSLCAPLLLLALGSFLPGCAPRADSAAAMLPRPILSQPCPRWTDTPLNRTVGDDAVGLGCANTMNIRAMAERPEDLEHGRPIGPADGEHATKAVENYQQGKAANGHGAAGAAPAIVIPGAGG